MQITETGSEKLKKSYRIIIEAADIERATEEELKSLGRKVKIPGFRPGFVPMKVLQQRYGKSVQADVLKNVVNESTEKAIKQNNLRLALMPEVKVEDYQEGGALTFTVEVETMPEIPELAFASIDLEREVYEISDAEIDDAAAKFAKRYPRMDKLADSAKAAEGNVVIMDFVGKIDGKPFEGGSAKKFRVELGSGQLIDGFEEQLVGVKAGDTKVVKVSFPENYFNVELANKPAEFDITVHEVHSLTTPEVDDAFAKERGLADLRALREAIRNQIAKEYDGIVRSRVKKRLFDILEEKCDFLLPEKMVQTEFDTIWNRLQEAKAKDVDVYEGRTEDEVKEDYRRISERRVKLGLLLAEIGQKQKLKVSSDELTRALMEHARQFPGQEQAVYDYYRRNPARLDELRGPILEEKAVDWVLQQVKLKDLKVTPKELEESLEEDNSPAKSDKSEAKKPAAKKKSTATKKKSAGADNE